MRNFGFLSSGPRWPLRGAWLAGLRRAQDVVTFGKRLAVFGFGELLCKSLGPPQLIANANPRSETSAERHCRQLICIAIFVACRAFSPLAWHQFQAGLTSVRRPIEFRIPHSEFELAHFRFAIWLHYCAKIDLAFDEEIRKAWAN